MKVAVITTKDDEGKIIERLRIEDHINLRMVDFNKIVKDHIIYLLENEHIVIQHIEIDKFDSLEK